MYFEWILVGEEGACVNGFWVGTVMGIGGTEGCVLVGSSVLINYEEGASQWTSIFTVMVCAIEILLEN